MPTRCFGTSGKRRAEGGGEHRAEVIAERTAERLWGRSDGDRRNEVALGLTSVAAACARERILLAVDRSGQIHTICGPARRK